MELQISFRVCAKIPDKGILQRETTGSGKDPERAVRVEKDKNSRGRSVPGPCAYALGDTAEILRFKFRGIPVREEQPNAVRTVSGAEVQIPEPGVLVPRVLCRHGREEHETDRGVHQAPAG